MSSTILLPSHRPSLTGLVWEVLETIQAVLSAAYNRESDIEPFGL